MKLATLGFIALLATIVVIILFANGGDGDTPTLQIIPGGETSEIPTSISCDNSQQCVDYIKEQDPEETNPRARCDSGTCTLIVDKNPMVEVE